MVAHVRVKAVDLDTGRATAFAVNGPTGFGLTGTVRAANGDFYSVVDGVRQGEAHVSTHVRCTLATGARGEQAVRKGQVWECGSLVREWPLRQDACQPLRNGETAKHRKSPATWHL